MDIQAMVSDLKAEHKRIDQAIDALEGLSSSSSARRGRLPEARQVAPAPGMKRHGMSAAARKRISEAMKLRWAKWKGKSAPRQANAKPQKTAVRGPMSAAAKKKLSALMKARWAAKKSAKA